MKITILLIGVALAQIVLSERRTNVDYTETHVNIERGNEDTVRISKNNIRISGTDSQLREIPVDEVIAIGREDDFRVSELLWALGNGGKRRRGHRRRGRKRRKNRGRKNKPPRDGLDEMRVPNQGNEYSTNVMVGGVTLPCNGVSSELCQGKRNEDLGNEQPKSEQPEDEQSEDERSKKEDPKKRRPGKGQGGKGQGGKGQGGKGQGGKGQQAERGQAGRGQSGTGQAGRGQTERGQTERGQAGRGQTETGQAGRGQSGRGQSGRGQTERGQTERGQAGRGQSATDEAGRGKPGRRQPGTNQPGKGPIGNGQRVPVTEDTNFAKNSAPDEKIFERKRVPDLTTTTTTVRARPTPTTPKRTTTRDRTGRKRGSKRRNRGGTSGFGIPDMPSLEGGGGGGGGGGSTLLTSLGNALGNVVEGGTDKLKKVAGWADVGLDVAKDATRTLGKGAIGAVGRSIENSGNGGPGQQLYYPAGTNFNPYFNTSGQQPLGNNGYGYPGVQTDINSEGKPEPTEGNSDVGDMEHSTTSVVEKPDVTEGRGDVTEGKGDAPEGRGDAPEGRGDAPEGRGDAPEGRRDVPGEKEDVPEDKNPPAPEETPQTSGNEVPENADPVDPATVNSDIPVEDPPTEGPEEENSEVTPATISSNSNRNLPQPVTDQPTSSVFDPSTSEEDEPLITIRVSRQNGTAAGKVITVNKNLWNVTINPEVPPHMPNSRGKSRYCRAKRDRRYLWTIPRECCGPEYGCDLFMPRPRKNNRELRKFYTKKIRDCECDRKFYECVVNKSRQGKLRPLFRFSGDMCMVKRPGKSTYKIISTISYLVYPGYAED